MPRRPTDAVRSARGVWRALRRHPVRAALGAVLLVVGLAACDSTGTYPLDIFSEMHYQKSYRANEPPRLLPPDGAVPVTGRPPSYTADQLAQLSDPLPRDPATVARGQQLFNVNCAVCHGADARGDGRMASFYAADNAPKPADLTAPAVAGLSDGQLYGVLVNGFGAYMPAFGPLLTDNDRWALVQYLRQAQGR